MFMSGASVPGGQSKRNKKPWERGAPTVKKLHSGGLYWLTQTGALLAAGMPKEGTLAGGMPARTLVMPIRAMSGLIEVLLLLSIRKTP
jgi:hypothetical protein